MALVVVELIQQVLVVVQRLDKEMMEVVQDQVQDPHGRVQAVEEAEQVQQVGLAQMVVLAAQVVQKLIHQ